jgi:tetratricopeptide (TPR) repeat protein
MDIRIAIAVLLVSGGLAFAQPDSAAKYIERGDHYMSMYQFRLAAGAYKIALMHDPENHEAWEKHRQAFDRVKAVGHYLDKARHLKREGRFEEASAAARQAVKLDPRNTEAWKYYEVSLEHDPDVVVVQSEHDAWDAYREAKSLYEAGQYEAAMRHLDEVYKYTQDPHLKYYAKSYLQKTQLKLKERDPSWNSPVIKK